MSHLLLAIIYLSFISLGLPDSLLGAAWPSIYPQLDVPLSFAGIVSGIIALGTILSSLLSDRLSRKLGTGKLTAISVAMTAAALFGFSVSGSFFMLCLWAIPYGLGAGSVDASLNNYVALHYKSHHMSWLHCFWGVGASLGPTIMGHALTGGFGWNSGYRWISLIQTALTLCLFLSLPLWKRKTQDDAASGASSPSSPLSLREILQVPGVKQVLLLFFCYCAVEQGVGLWASSFLHLHAGVPSDLAAGLGSMFFLGITVGRAISGFVTMKLHDAAMIRLGSGILLAGVLILFLPGTVCAICGMILIGLGCAPIYPAVIHSTPTHFGAEKSQAIIGVQMASAYCGTCLMPPLFGVLARHFSVSLLPWFSLLFALILILSHEKLEKITR